MQRMINISRQKKSFIYGLSIPVLIIVVGSFFIDFGLNSKYFIKRDFSRAMDYRLVGDCESFKSYTADAEDWFERCEKEKQDGLKNPLKDFEIKKVSHKLFSDKAFLQVELNRPKAGQPDYLYIANYDMTKDGLIWKISQDIE